MNPNSVMRLIWDSSHTHRDGGPYPLRVSWPRRLTRCTSLWSSVPVKRLAWYCPVPGVSPQHKWNDPTHMAAHPSSTWASFPDAIGPSGYPSKTQLPPCYLALSLALRSPCGPRLRSLDLDLDQKSWCALQSRG